MTGGGPSSLGVQSISRHMHDALIHRVFRLQFQRGEGVQHCGGRPEPAGGGGSKHIIPQKDCQVALGGALGLVLGRSFPSFLKISCPVTTKENQKKRVLKMLEKIVCQSVCQPALQVYTLVWFSGGFTLHQKPWHCVKLPTSAVVSTLQISWGKRSCEACWRQHWRDIAGLKGHL